MDLLSLVSMSTKRRGDFFSQAEALAKKYKDQPKLEKRMAIESKALVKGLRDKQMRWEEYERSLLEKTILSALASVYLGSQESNPQAKMERAWPTIVGDMLPPLLSFLEETKTFIDSGDIRLGDKTEEFAEVMGWPGLALRVIRYIANPSYSFFNLGQYYVRQEQGYKEMRRVPISDGKVCPDCIYFGQLDWQPMGSLPMPGRDCRCYDRCRCRVEYQ